MISDIFIARPRLAFVVSVVMVLAGLIALTRIPVAQYPDIVPPQVTVTTTFPGASATTVESSVAVPPLSPSMSSDLDEVVRKVDPGAFLQRGALPLKLNERIQTALTDPNAGGVFMEV